MAFLLLLAFPIHAQTYTGQVSGTATATGILSSQINSLNSASTKAILTITVLGSPATQSIQIESSTNNGSTYSLCGTALTITTGTATTSCVATADHFQVNFTTLTGGTNPSVVWSLVVQSSSTGTATITPSGNASDGIAPVVSSAVESGHVLKASAGNLYDVYVTTTAAGLLMVFNSTTVPGDGAVTPIHCIPAVANQEVGLTFNSGPPEVYSTGISIALSSGTNCFSKTAIANGFFHGRVK